MPVHYDPAGEEADAWDALPIGRTVAMPPSPPPIPPGTLSVPREVMRRGRMQTVHVTHVLRIDTHTWTTWLRSVATLFAATPYAAALPAGKLTDEHTGVTWTIRLDAENGTADRFAFTGRPVTPYTVHLPIDPARTRDAAALADARYVHPLRGKIGVPA
ncbi:MAG: hypothetical protein HOV66_12205 [Streptomycetaceae bacterium]|nr:hypothetical protein [Streptomycetaceae bacterium]